MRCDMSGGNGTSAMQRCQSGEGAGGGPVRMFGRSFFVDSLGRQSWSAVLVESHLQGRHRQSLSTKLGDQVFGSGRSSWSAVLVGRPCRLSPAGSASTKIID